jgi:hypothetical protein
LLPECLEASLCIVPLVVLSGLAEEDIDICFSGIVGVCSSSISSSAISDF